MEFDKNKVYTAANADSLRTGSMGYHADNLEALKKRVSSEVNEEYGMFEKEAKEYAKSFEKEYHTAYGALFVRYDDGTDIICNHPPKEEPTLFDFLD